MFNENRKERYIMNEIEKRILNFWNERNITNHKKLSEKAKKLLNRKLVKYTVEDIELAIDRYGQIYHNPSYFFNYKGKLEWLLLKIDTFLDGGNVYENYKIFLENQEKNKSYGKEIRSYYIDKELLLNFEIYCKDLGLNEGQVVEDLIKELIEKE